MSELADKIQKYYEIRKLNRPNVWEALGWANAELGEVYEVLLSRGQWVRNNPEAHPVKTREDFAEELGDVIMMLMMAGMLEGVDPINALYNKMEKKLEANGFKLATFTSNLENEDAG